MNIRSRIYFLKITISLVIIALVFYYIDIRLVLRNLHDFNLSFIPLILLAFILRLLLASISLWILLKPYVKLTISQVFLLNSYSLTLGYFTPAQLGETTLALFLRKHHLKLEHGMALFIMNKFVTLLFAMLFGIYGLTYFNISPWLYFLSLLGIITVLFLAFIPKIRCFLRDKIIERYFSKLYLFFKTFSDILSKHKVILMLNALVNIVKLVVAGSIFYLCLRALGLDIDFFTVLFVSYIGRLIASIPITVAGIGVLESSITMLFAHLGYDKTIVLSAVFSMRILVLLFITSVFIYALLSKDTSLKDYLRNKKIT